MAEYCLHCFAQSGYGPATPAPNPALWTAIADDGGPTYLYIPVAADVDKWLRATVSWESPGWDQTTNTCTNTDECIGALTSAVGPVLATHGFTGNDLVTITANDTAQVGQTLSVALPDATRQAVDNGTKSRGVWQWQRSTDYTDDNDGSNDTWTNVTPDSVYACGSARTPLYQYTAVTADQDNYGRAFVYVSDADGTNTQRVETAVVGPVAAE